ncbi:hypothetical protein Trydic_g14320, partial [Trypoxylus dichotomus]
QLLLYRLVAHLERNTRKMKTVTFKYFTLFVIAIVLMNFMQYAESTYRKPPFNGSIFGKRGTSIDYDNGAGKALSSMCEIASEACQAWFPSQDK